MDHGGLQHGRKAMALRCEEAAAIILADAGVVAVTYHERLQGTAYFEQKAVRVPRPTTRRRLYIVAHEAGHVALRHSGNKPVHRQEYEAERYAHAALKQHGIAVPKKSTTSAKHYVAWKNRQAIRRGAKEIDRESYRWCEAACASLFTEKDRMIFESVKLGDLS
jgi:hypothetical protein